MKRSLQMKVNGRLEDIIEILNDIQHNYTIEDLADPDTAREIIRSIEEASTAAAEAHQILNL